jgi:hypothetical protein
MMSTTTHTAPPKPWIVTTAQRRCPVCRRAGCLTAGDPVTAVVCRNVESTKAIGSVGWLHELTPGPTWAPWRRALPRLAKT